MNREGIYKLLYWNCLLNTIFNILFSSKFDIVDFTLKLGHHRFFESIEYQAELSQRHYEFKIHTYVYFRDQNPKRTQIIYIYTNISINNNLSILITEIMKISNISSQVEDRINAYECIILRWFQKFWNEIKNLLHLGITSG